jgi:shikimate 5-dehydrogenase
MSRLEPAAAPTFYFIGVTTAKSSIMRAFPKWAKLLGLDAVIKGIDLPLHAQAEKYREVVRFIRDDPLSAGALVTTHKLDLFAACGDMFDYIDPFAEKLKEVSSLSKNRGAFCAHAKDPISSGLALEAFVPDRFWADHGGEALLLGAGGSSLAMALYFSQEKFSANAPRRLTIANRSKPRLESAKAVLEGICSFIDFRFVHSPAPENNDALAAALPSYSLIVNATGLGKDAPGSPLSWKASYPEHSLIWEINYRGDLVFKDQAEKQAAERDLRIEDGWNYFIYGWTQVIAEVFHISISPSMIEKLNEAAKK